MAFATVDGTVTKIFASKGFAVTEKWQQGDYERKRRWAVFFKGDVPAVDEGQQVKVTGVLQTEVSDGFQGRDGQTHYAVNHKLGNARLAGEQKQNAQSPHPDTYGPQTGAQDAWGTDETPF